jgi:hypothetical protein
MSDKQFRIPLKPEQHNQLAGLLKDVPVRKVIQYDWTSESGREFIKQLRLIQISGVPLPWIADALDVTPASLSGAIGYWERASTTRGNSARRRREKRPLRKALPEGKG